MSIQKIKILVEEPEINFEALSIEVNSEDHLEIARLLHHLSKEGKILVFNCLDCDLKRCQVLYETDRDSRVEIHESLVRQGCFEPSSFRDCFNMDECKANPAPKGILKKIKGLFVNSRYSMSVFMRMSQFFYLKYINSTGKVGRFYRFGAYVTRKLNIIANQFEHGMNPNVEAGVIFKHPNVCITGRAVIESGAYIYRGVTLGFRGGKAPHIKKNAKIASHSIILGGVTVGEKAIVGAGAVVLADVPAGKIAAGTPAKIIGDVTEETYNSF